MEWVYDAPIKDKRLRKIQSFLEKKTRDNKAAERVVKALSLNDFIREHAWKSASEIQSSVFHDSAKKRPVFNERQSKTIYRVLNQSGGAPNDDAILLDRGIRNIIGYTRSYLPNVVVNVSDLAYPYVTFLKTLQENPTVGPVVELVKELVIEVTTTGIVAADAIASEVGGPVGVAIVAIPAAIAAMMVVMTHVLADELGEALTASFLILPFAGPILYKVAVSADKLSKKVAQRRQDILDTTKSFLGDDVAKALGDKIPMLLLKDETPSTAGNRLSTQRRRYFKWRLKTRRSEFGKV
jgi:hypothetical protein